MSAATRADPPGPCLQGPSFDQAFPFHVLMDAGQVCVCAGPALRQACPGLVPGANVRDWLEVSRPVSLKDSRDWLSAQGTPLVLSTRHPPVFKLRGGVHAQPDGHVLVLMTPVVTSQSELSTLGLDMRDLALHDPSADLLLLQQAAVASLNDAKRLSDRLRRRGQLLQAMMELSGHGMMAFDEQGLPLQGNQELLRLMQAPPETPWPSWGQLGGWLGQRLAAEHDTWSLDAFLLRAQAAQPCTETLRTRDDSFWRVSLRITDDQTRVLYLVDVTEETQLSLMKSRFLSTAAHELRTPLVSVLGFSEMLALRDLPPEKAKDAARTIWMQSKRLVSLINELLDLARIESRQGMDFQLQPGCLAELAAMACGTYRGTPEQERVELIPAASPAMALVDAAKARQAVENVIGNALKYSHAGRPVQVSVQPGLLEALGPGLAPRPAWQLVIEDEGPGMAPADLKRIFERFFRADPSCTLPGTGLGMSLVQEIMRAHHGHVEVSQVPGRGLRVARSFPAAPCED